MKYYVYCPDGDRPSVTTVEASSVKDAANKIAMSTARINNLTAQEMKEDYESILDSHMFVPESEIDHIS